MASRALCFIAAVLSASTGVTARDKVDRLEARTAFRAPEPDAQPGAPQAAVAAEPGARQAVVVAPDVQREAAVADAAVAAEPDAQQAAAVEPDARQAVAVEPDVQQAAAVALDAQQGAASDAQQGAEEAAVSDAQLGAAVAAASDVQQAAVSAPMVGSVKLRVRRLAASVEARGRSSWLVGLRRSSEFRLASIRPIGPRGLIRSWHYASNRPKNRLASSVLVLSRACLLWVNNGPWVASELGPLIPQQRTCSDYCGMSVWCQQRA